MRREEIQKLVGGYATGTLSEVERKALFAAALEDQSLFDAIADEAALKELLDDPQVRADLLAALPPKTQIEGQRWPVRNWAGAAGAIAAVLVVGVFLLRAPAPEKLAVPQLVASSASPVADGELQLAGKNTVEAVAKNKTLGRAVKPATPEMEKRATQADELRTLPAAPPFPPSGAGLAGGNTKDAKLEEKDTGARFKSPSVLLPQPLRPSSQAVSVAAAAPPVEESASKNAPSPAAQIEAESLAATTGMQQAIAGTPLGARQMFYTAGAGGYIPSQAKLSQRAKLAANAVGARMTETGGVPGIRYTILRREQDGTFLEVDPATVFHPGESVRLRLEANSAGFLAVWDGQTALANLSILARTKYTIPAEGAIDLNGAPGEKNLLVVFSRQPEKKPSPLMTGVLVEQSKEPATYVAEPQPGARVSFEIKLTYR